MATGSGSAFLHLRPARSSTCRAAAVGDAPVTVLPPAEAATGEVVVEGRRLRLTNLDKLLWPLARFTKRDLLAYYESMAAILVPHIADRPLTLRRFPDGVDGLDWFQTQCRGRPEWLPSVAIPGRKGAVQRYCVVNDLASLLWVANLATIELHPFLATRERPDRPLAVVFDLDPGPPASILGCCEVGLLLRRALEGLGLASFPKTSGSIGLHVYVPLTGSATYDQTKRFARTFAARMAERRPELVVDRMALSLRGGRVFVDWGQNDHSKSTVAPYSLRGLPWPTVSTPVTWGEVERAIDAGRPELLTFVAEDVPNRVERLGDLFRPVLDLEQRLPPANEW
jgi:bifunctional non-homologous end joining protein LigD